MSLGGPLCHVSDKWHLLGPPHPQAAPPAGRPAPHAAHQAFAPRHRGLAGTAPQVSRNTPAAPACSLCPTVTPRNRAVDRTSYDRLNILFFIHLFSE